MAPCPEKNPAYTSEHPGPPATSRRVVPQAQRSLDEHCCLGFSSSSSLHLTPVCQKPPFKAPPPSRSFAPPTSPLPRAMIPRQSNAQVILPRLWHRGVQKNSVQINFISYGIKIVSLSSVLDSELSLRAVTRYI